MSGGSANYETKYNSVNFATPEEFEVTENMDTVGPGRSGETQYKYITFDTPDEDEVPEYDFSGGKRQGTQSDDGLSSGSPRARAREGMKRRRLANRSMARKLRDEVHGLFEVMLACTFMVGSWTKEIIEDPLWEAWAVMQPKHHVKRREAKTDCLELFAGEARISSAYARRKRAVLQPRDMRYDHDLRRVGDQDEVVDEIIQHRPRLVWAAPPCTYWCKFSHLNYSKQELRRLRKREMNLIKFTSRVFELQSGLGGIAVIELQRFVGDRACFADVDLCTFGLRSLQDGRPLRKPLALMTNDQAFTDEISQRCEDPQHDHRPIQGRDTAWTAVYPTAFATAVLHAVDHAWHHPKGQLTEVEDWAVEPVGADAISFKGKVNPKVAAVLKRVHQNLGHPPNRDLVRHLRLGGAPENVIRAAEQMVCRTCERSTRPQSSRVAQPCVALDSNEAIAADVIWLDTVDVKNKPALNVVDLASTYQVAIPVSSTKSEELGRALLDGWISWAGAPKHLLVDLDHSPVCCRASPLAEWSLRTSWSYLEGNMEQAR
eukprot:s39_g20.t1